MGVENILAMTEQEHEQAHSLTGGDPVTTIQLARLEKSMNAVAKVFLGLGERIQALEAIVQSQITITGAEAKTIHEAVRSRAREFCDMAHVSYQDAGRKVRKAIWRDLLNEFSLSNYHDLPKRSFQSGLDYIRDWRSYAMAKKLNQLYKGGSANG